MSEFRDLEKKAESYAEEHPEQADKGIGKAAEFAERETGHKEDSEIQRAAGAAEKYVSEHGQQQGQNQGQDQGQDQGQQGNQS